MFAAADAFVRDSSLSQFSLGSLADAAFTRETDEPRSDGAGFGFGFGLGRVELDGSRVGGGWKHRM